MSDLTLVKKLEIKNEACTSVTDALQGADKVAAVNTATLVKMMPVIGAMLQEMTDTLVAVLNHLERVEQDDIQRRRG